jgi:glycosyltransferase involved in cell wall biosynthesis
MPLISVIIPTFNAENTIHEAVSSALNQSFSDIEVLVINDGSTDKTLAKLAKIKDPRLRVLSFANGGVAASRNRGIQNAKGQYLSFLDSDDAWAVNKLERQLSALHANPKASIAYSWSDYMDTNGQFLQHGWHADHDGDVYETLFCGCFIENGSNILVDREAVTKVGLFDASVTPAEDWDFYLRLAERYHFVCVPEVHVFYRISPTSLSTQIERMERGGKIVLHRALKYSPKRLHPLKKAAFADFYSYLFHKSYSQAVDRRHWWTTLNIFVRGLWVSPKFWNKVAKRRLWHAITGVIKSPPSNLSKQQK